MPHHTLFSRSTRLPLCCINGDINADTLLEDELMAEGDLLLTHHVDPQGNIVENNVFDPHVSVNPVSIDVVAHITGIPESCMVEHDGETYEVDDGSFEFSSPIAGQFTFIIKSFAHHDVEVIINVEG